ncbi:MAG: phospholipid carrier-dependent glycosyltransferase [Candidatus Shapirobacteria bacterium]|nr:phospholipid carrier-dependent glycosyltransferase [Candidatus Shapirobacteria bacterium]
MVTKLIKSKLIIAILLLAAMIRFYNIGALPSLNPDEAALGYNAYSLLQTGKDEHGAAWPLHFQSFGDYKPGGYVYLDLPFITAFGLTPLAVRLPNLILSIFTIYLIYKLVLLLSSNYNLSIISAFVLTINPWHIHFSRGAWESSTALFFIILGLFWFYSYIISHKSYLIFLFPLPLVTSLYIYHSARIIVPVIFLILIIFNFKLFLKSIKPALLSLLVAIILTVPVLTSFVRSGGTTRFGGVGLTADYGPIARAEELLNEHGNTKLINRIIHNKRVLYTISWAQKYFSHFDYNFLFLKGDDVPRSKSPDMGQFYLFEVPLLFFGIIFVLKSKTPHLKSLLFSFLFIAPLASSLTFQAPSALRALPMVIPLSIFIAFGITKLSYFKYLLIPLYLFSFLFYLDSYFVHSPQRYSFAWNRGFSDIVPFVNINKSKYQNIFFTNKYDQPYILYLFFSQYPPQQIQSQIKLTSPDKFGFSTVDQIDNITFHIPEVIPQNSLVVDSSDFLSTGKSFKIYTK